MPSPIALRTWFALLALTLSGCGHFQAGSKGYQFSGEFRTPSSYATNESYRPNSSFRLEWPVNDVRLNRGFLGTARRPHQGVDLGGPLGTPILAAHEGVVIYSGRQFRGFGNMVIVEYDKQWATLYGHLSKITVREGDVVKLGEQIGKMGRTGRATGVHLHFELMHNRLPIDPLPLLSPNGQIAGR